jgi:hypothetical protein
MLVVRRAVLELGLHPLSHLYLRGRERKVDLLRHGPKLLTEYRATLCALYIYYRRKTNPLNHNILTSVPKVMENERIHYIQAIHSNNIKNQLHEFESSYHITY